MRRVSHSHRPAFTLVELLMVVTIIGILVGLIVPAVYIAMRSAKSAGLAMEINTLANAIDQYKNKYGDYPPDGSNMVRFEQHFRKIFPQMLDSEFQSMHRPANGNASDRLAKVSNGAPQGVMDPAEALVFALGGFSEDPTHPFTGSGGPFSLVPSTTSYQYNVDRNNPLFEFKEANLTLQTVTSGSATATLSSDEADLGFGGLTDALPVYRPPYGLQLPYVYFESRTYASAAMFGNTPGTFFNNYSPPGLGAARPYRSGKTNTNLPNANGANANAYYRYEGDKSYQLICAGLDDLYGGVPFAYGNNYSMPGTVPPSPSGGFGPIFYAFPTGESLDFGPVNGTTSPKIGQFSRYYDTDGAASGQLDNVTNFSDGQLKDGLSN